MPAVAAQQPENPFANLDLPSNAPQLPAGPTPSRSFAANPYQPTLGVSDGLPSGENRYEVLRQRHLKQEASIRSIGTLYYLNAGFFGITAVICLIGFAASAQNGRADPALLVVSVVIAGLAAGIFVVARGLRQLKDVPRVFAILFSALGLLAFPFGTLISGYFLYLLCSANANIIFSDEYREAVRQTPHMKYKSSIVALILVALLIVVLVVGFIGVFVSFAP